jgi:hypothetical protein
VRLPPPSAHSVSCLLLGLNRNPPRAPRLKRGTTWVHVPRCVNDFVYICRLWRTAKFMKD